MNAGISRTCPEDEWQARVDLADAYRLTHHFDMTALIYNHITDLVSGTDDQFLINEYGNTTSAPDFHGHAYSGALSNLGPGAHQLRYP